MNKEDLTPKVKELESANLKLEFEISRLHRENARLHVEINQLRGRGVKALVHEIISKIDGKITANLKKLNKPKKPDIALDELDHKLTDKTSRKQLLRVAERVDLKSFYVMPKQRLSYLIPFKLYKGLFALMLFVGRMLWRLWSLMKRLLKKAVK